MEDKKFKIFKTLQANHAIVGITTNRTRNSNERILVTFLLSGMALICSVLFLLGEVNTFVEYINNVYISTGLAMTIINYSIVISKMAKLFSFIDNVEKVISQSMYIVYTMFFHSFELELSRQLNCADKHILS